MRVLLLGALRQDMVAILRASGDEVVQTEDPVRPGDLEGVDFLVSFGYRHLITREVLDRFPGRVINLHISLLPWNRGADPNLWSFLENSPKGVSIHVVDEGLDTGPILAQQEVAHEPDDTLASSYARLVDAVVQLFATVWTDVRGGRLIPRPQQGTGSFHYARDRARYEPLLVAGWHTRVASVAGKALDTDGPCRTT